MPLIQRLVAAVSLAAYLAVSMGNALLHNHDHGHSHVDSETTSEASVESQTLCHHGHCHHHPAPSSQENEQDQPVAPHDHEHDCPACQYESLPVLLAESIAAPTPCGWMQNQDSAFEQHCSAESVSLPPSRGPPSIG